MAQIIGLIQVKGGAGRSTIATNLAACLASQGRTVLIDTDLPQGSSSSWGAVRAEENLLGELQVVQVKDHQSLVEAARHFNESHDFVVIDGPPRFAAVTRAILIMSDLCLVPLGASAVEVWATSDVQDIIDSAKAQGIRVDARIVWNRYRAYTRSAREIVALAKEELQIPDLNARLGFRVAYSEALSRGLMVDEWTDKLARGEFSALVLEIMDILNQTMTNPEYSDYG